ncbi:MAG: pantoate--beta-alanine ligase [Actinobacteria bacterium RBG_13_35_12]|jgi:pantoate--beta-alanine ligase|nr:MAG: pantoate--beta-alanine ligase [Actinobacteria bacterium RBG_13_35_12]
MKIIKKINDCKSIVNFLRKKGYKIGFVPTMGFLHEGHLNLIRMAKKDCDKVFISIFVNPAQFGPGEDYKKYPRDIKRDSAMAEKEGVDYIFYPTAKGMYGPDHKTVVEVKELGDIMCGKYRPGHFAGVTTVVLKLFDIINAHKAYFGQKDYQQMIIIKKMVADLNLDIEILCGPTIREKDGLALSSRNKYLSVEERRNATILYRCLNIAEGMVKKGEKDLEKIKKIVLDRLKENRFVKRVDYFEFRDPGTLEKRKSVDKDYKNILAAVAVWIGNTRLIDNIIIKI